jgi:hypothetical protein
MTVDQYRRNAAECLASLAFMMDLESEINRYGRWGKNGALIVPLGEAQLDLARWPPAPASA